MNELELLQDADQRAQAYVAGIESRRVFPDAAVQAALAGFHEDLPNTGFPASDTLELMDELGSPATVASNGPNYFGFVIGASLPVAAAAERLALAWDQCHFPHLHQIGAQCLLLARRIDKGVIGRLQEAGRILEGI